MDIPPLYAHIFAFGYFSSVMVLAVTSLLLCRKHRSAIAGFAGALFVVHLAGNHIMRLANSEFVEAQQTHVGQALAESHYLCGNALSLAGIVGGSVLMFLFAWRSNGVGAF